MVAVIGQLGYQLTCVAARLKHNDCVRGCLRANLRHGNTYEGHVKEDTQGEREQASKQAARSTSGRQPQTRTQGASHQATDPPHRQTAERQAAKPHRRTSEQAREQASRRTSRSAHTQPCSAITSVPVDYVVKYVWGWCGAC